MSFTATYGFNTPGSIVMPMFVQDVDSAPTYTIKSIEVIPGWENYKYCQGYKFSKWNTASDGSGTTYYPGNTVSTVSMSSITLYAVWKPTIYTFLGPNITAIADKIREKVSGLTSKLSFPAGFISEIDKLTDTRDANATAADILSPKTAYVNKAKVTGSIPSKEAATYNTSTSDQEIDAGQYLSGKQTIKGVTTENIDAGNIKPGVTMKVGDANNAGRIKNVESSMTAKAAATYNTSTSDQTIPADQYLTGAQTIKGVYTSNIDAGNIKNGVVVKVGDANDNGRIKNVTGTFTKANTVSSGQTAAAAAQIRSGYSAWVDGAEVKGSIPAKAAATYNTSTSDQTISASQYLTGAQTIKGVTTENIDAGNIKNGVVVKVGDANSATRIKNVTGTFTKANTVSSGQTAAAAAQIRSGYSAWVDGVEVKGSIAAKAAATYNTSTSDQTISASQYLTGAQTIRGVYTYNIIAGNIKSGVVVKVGDANDNGRIINTAGTFTKANTVSSGQTAATAAKILSGYSAWVDGAEVKGSIASKSSSNVGVSGNTVSVPVGYYGTAVSKTVGTAKAAATYNTSTSDQSIAAGYYLSGAQTIKGVTTENITAENIRTGITVKVGDSNSAGRIKSVTGTCAAKFTSYSETVTYPSAAKTRTSGMNAIGTYSYSTQRRLEIVSASGVYFTSSKENDNYVLRFYIYSSQSGGTIAANSYSVTITTVFASLT